MIKFVTCARSLESRSHAPIFSGTPRERVDRNCDASPLPSRGRAGVQGGGPDMKRRHLLSVLSATLAVTLAFTQSGPAEAPTGFDDQTNGFANQTQFDLDRETFEERETIDDGLGPVYNVQACAECHQ